jgi:outer membrane protein OmpA-like peptidoglycan-associated protein
MGQFLTRGAREVHDIEAPPNNEIKLSDNYKNVVNIEADDIQYDGKKAIIYSSHESYALFVPYVKEHPEQKYLIECFTECPISKCTPKRCARLTQSEQKCRSLIDSFRSNGCRNDFEIIGWGCTNEKIDRKNLIKITPVKKPGPIVLPPVVVRSAPIEPAPQPEPPKPKSTKLKMIGHSVKAALGAKAQVRKEIKELLMARQIEFVKNEAALSEEGEDVVFEVAQFLLTHPDIVINVESHTNCRSGKCDNGCYLMDLSQRRVDTVRDQLISHGCRNQFKTHGWGCKHPSVGNVRLVRIFPDDDDDDDDEGTLGDFRRDGDFDGVDDERPVESEPPAEETPKPAEVSKEPEPEPEPELPAPVLDAVAPKPKSSRFKAVGTSVAMHVRMGNVKAQVREEIKELLTAKEIQFVKNEAALSDEGKSVVDEVAGFLLKHPELRMHIESHTNCVTGKKSRCVKTCYLADLSQQRVDIVKERLIRSGCTNDFETRGWGCKHPLYANIRLVRIFPEEDDDNDD